MLGLQRTVGNTAVSETLEAERMDSPVERVLGSSTGSALDDSTRSYMESRLGQDFGDVRIHTGPLADESARSLNSNAYTVGTDVVFRRGMYEPNTEPGRRTIAHELTHVMQQKAGPVDGTPGPGGIRVSDPSDTFEQAAERMADRIVAGERVGGAVTAPAAAQREAARGEDEETDEAVVQNEAVSTLIAQRETVEERTAYLDEQYNNWLKEGNFGEAAEKLNTFSEEDIRKRVGQLTPWQESQMHEGAVHNPRVGPDSNVALMTGEKHWEQAAEKLNGFSEEDIGKQLRQLTPWQKSQMHQGALRNLRVGPDSNVALMTKEEAPEGFLGALFDYGLEFLTVEGLARVLEGGTKWVPVIGGAFMGVAVLAVEQVVSPTPHSGIQAHRVFRAAFADKVGPFGLLAIKADTTWHTNRQNAQKEVDEFNKEYADKPGYGRAIVQEGISTDRDDPD